MLGLPSYGQGWITQPWHKLGLSLAGPRLDYSALVHAWVTIVRPRLDNPTLAQAWVIVGMAKDGFSRPGPSMVNQWHGQGWVKRSGPRVALYRYAKARLPSTGPGSAPLSALGNSCMGLRTQE
ncbi:hypothetical protein WA026_010037 [Henosepilachna vigintioctopunctata]|uniref:Uncharacterized protein n=1 Tax=Henosepilachna vigintioctopunctata TaxID=420089 RepID=A0AAW1UC91_9CUCU